MDPDTLLIFCVSFFFSGPTSASAAGAVWRSASAAAASTYPAPWSSTVAAGMRAALAEPTIADRICDGVADGVWL